MREGAPTGVDLNGIRKHSVNIRKDTLIWDYSLLKARRPSLLLFNVDLNLTRLQHAVFGQKHFWDLQYNSFQMLKAFKEETICVYKLLRY